MAEINKLVVPISDGQGGYTPTDITFEGSGSGLPDETITYEQFMAKTDAQQLAYTGYVSGWPDGGGGGGYTPIVLTGTLEAGETEITFTDSNILEYSMIDIFIDSDDDVAPTAKESSVGEVTLTFDEQENDLFIALLIFNLITTPSN